MIRQQAAWAVDGARDARGNGLVDGDVASAALVAIAFALPLLVSSNHIVVLLHGAVSVVHFSVSIVGRAARSAVEVLVVHANLQRANKGRASAKLNHHNRRRVTKSSQSDKGTNSSPLCAIIRCKQANAGLSAMGVIVAAQEDPVAFFGQRRQGNVQ